jgi:uncharacterized protein (DUF924 family)
MATAEEVLDFWFGPPARSESDLLVKVQRWFAGGPALDAEIQRRFGPDVESALAGERDFWAESPQGLLALVLLLDQFPRSIHRGTPRAFDGDARAMALAEAAHARGLERDLDWEQRHFLMMPYLHVESADANERARTLLEQCLEQCPPMYRSVFAAGIEQADKYRGVLLRFGRFPHRNEALGRISTPEEIEFSKDWDQRARPGIMQRKDESPG